jgi:hypothetical protein
MKIAIVFLVFLSACSQVKTTTPIIDNHLNQEAKIDYLRIQMEFNKFDPIMPNMEREEIKAVKEDLLDMEDDSSETPYVEREIKLEKDWELLQNWDLFFFGEGVA